MSDPLLLALGLAAVTVVANPTSAQVPEGEGDFDAAVDAFFDRYFAFHPTQASRAGLHDYDPRLGDRDRASIEAYLADLRALEDRFEAFDPADLDEDARLDREIVLREIRGERFWLDEVGTWRKDPRFYAREWDLTLLLLLDYAPLEARMASIVARLERFPDLVAAARANVENPPRPYVETALITYRGWPRFLEGELPAALEGVDDPALQARFREARDAAVRAIESYADHLERDVLPDASGDFALGPERYRRMNELLSGVDLPLDRLEAIGEAELARVEALADSLAAVIAPEATPEIRVEAAFDSLAADRPEPDAIVSTAAGMIDRLRTFVRKSGFGTVLQGDVEVREIPPFRRTNFAYIFIPGPFETAVTTGLYFIHPVEESWSESVTRDFLARNNTWSILNTSGHEAYPGHYHHFNHVVRAPTKAQKLLTAYVTTEGWAHYAEEAAWRAGLSDRDPRLGMAVVQDALLRVVRYLASIRLHTGQMTVEDAEEMFATVAYQDSVNARQQALRGTYDPEYLNYTLGKLMIGKLRGDLEAGASARGEPFDPTAFHDAFMAAGAPPVPWIGRRMTGDPRWEPLAP